MGFFSKIKRAADAWWRGQEPATPEPKKKPEAPKKTPRKAEKKPKPKPPKKQRWYSRKKKAQPPQPQPTQPPAKPSPAVAREMLMAKLHDMYWLQKKYDAAATSKRISRMTDAQVYRALDMSENDIETAVRARPTDHPELAPPDDPNSNIYWYHGSEAMFT